MGYAPELCGWAKSKIFRFLVGPEKREFAIHADLVAAQSPALSALVNNGMKESLDGCASWPQCDVDTFTRFLEFVYTGDFATPIARKLNMGEGPRAKAAETGVPPELFNETGKSNETWSSYYKSALDYKYDSAIVYDVYWDQDSYDDPTILPSIAKVYILADYYGVEKLASLSMYKLCRLLVIAKTCPLLVELIRLCLVKRCPPRLRKLVLDYSAFHLAHLMREDGFDELAKEHPGVLLEITRHFMACMTNGLDEDDEQDEDSEEYDSEQDEDEETK